MATTQTIAATDTARHDSFYIESSLPTGITIAEYRRSRPPRPTLWRRLRLRAA